MYQVHQFAPLQLSFAIISRQNGDPCSFASPISARKFATTIESWKDLLSQNVIACVRIDNMAGEGRGCVTDEKGSHGSHVIGGDAMM